MASTGELVIHGIVILFFFTGLYDVLLNVEDNECEMSYMFETPQFIQIPMSEEVANKYPRYGLHLYGEGHYHDVISNLQLEGIPVLYIPGNGGSKNQCRSVASFLLRKAEAKGWNPHFNVFTVDLNEELVAFYGGTLNDQVEFVHHSIKVILKIYQESTRSIKKPQSVVLLGHSMGGMVARGVFSSPGFDSKSVNLVYTLATPHAHPVFSIDMHIAQFYQSVNQHWNENCEALKDITLISVSGGDRDFQVHGAATKLTTCSNNSLSTASTSIPRAWVSADHQCAVWCKQVVLATTRSLFDMIDPDTKQISNDASVRYKSIHYHFKHNPGLSKYPDKDTTSKVKLLTTHEIETVTTPYWSSSFREIEAGPVYYTFDLIEMKENGKSFVVAKTTTSSDRWLLACNKDGCKSATDLSKDAYVTPKFKVAKLNVTQLINNKGFTKLILKVPKQTKTSGDVEVNFLTSEELDLEYTVPHIFSNLWTLDQGYNMNITIGNTAGRFYHRIRLTGLDSIFHAYKFTLSPLGEKNSQPLMEIEVPDQSSYTYAKYGNVTVKLRRTSESQVPTLHIYTDGKTEYKMIAKVQFVQLLGQIVRFHGSILPTMIALNCMLAFSYQLKLLSSGEPFLTTVAAHGISAKPYKVQPFINLVKKLYTYEGFFLAWHKLGLPVPDAVRLDDEFGIWFALLPFVMFIYGEEIFSMSIYIQEKKIKFFGNLFRKITPLKSGSKLMHTMTSSAVHMVIISLLVTQCGGLALIYVSLLSFMDLCVLSSIPVVQEKVTKNGDATKDDTKTSQAEESEETKQNGGTVETASVTKVDPTIVTYNIKLSMHQLWIILAVLSFPSIIAWSKGYSFQSGDPTFAFAVFGSFLFLLHRQADAMIQPTLARQVICRLLYPLTILTSMLCIHSFHRLPYFILSFMSFYVAMQFFG